MNYQARRTSGASHLLSSSCGRTSAAGRTPGDSQGLHKQSQQLRAVHALKAAKLTVAPGRSHLLQVGVTDLNKALLAFSRRQKWARMARIICGLAVYRTGLVSEHRVKEYGNGFTIDGQRP